MIEEFDKQIRDKLSQANTPPPAGGWEKIATEIPSGSTVSGSVKYIAIAILVLLSGIAIYFVIQPQKTIDFKAYKPDEAVDHPVRTGYAIIPIYTAQTFEQDNSENARLKSAQQETKMDAVTVRNKEDQTQVLTSQEISKNDKNETGNQVAEASSDQADFELLADRRWEKETFISSKDWNGNDLFLIDTSIKKVPQAHVMSVEKPVKERKNPIITGFYLNAQTFLNYNRVEANKNDEVLIKNLNQNTFSERVGFNFSGGIHKSLSNRVLFYGGLVYQTYLSKVSYNYTYQYPDSVNVISLNESFAATPIVEEREGLVEQRINSLGVELGAKYLISGPRFNNEFDLAVFGTQLLNQESVSHLSSNQLFLRVGYGVFYTTNSPWVIFAQPSLSYSMLSNKENSGVFNVQPFSLGMSLGVKYNFGKR